MHTEAAEPLADLEPNLAIYFVGSCDLKARSKHKYLQLVSYFLDPVMVPWPEDYLRCVDQWMANGLQHPLTNCEYVQWTN